MPINVNAVHLQRIGDALCATPYIAHLARKHNGAYVFGGYNRWVFHGLQAESLGIRVTGSPFAAYDTEYLDIHKVFNHCNTTPKGANLHFAQGWFAVNNETPPYLPLTLPLALPVATEFGPSNVNRVVVLSPFSDSDINNNKLWPIERWVSLCEYLYRYGLVTEVHVVGGGYEKGWEEFSGPLFKHVIGETLPEILARMRNAKITLSVDNGISHLAHFGGVHRHFLVQPQCLTPAFIRNPLGRSIRVNPLDLSEVQLRGLIKNMLSE